MRVIFLFLIGVVTLSPAWAASKPPSEAVQYAECTALVSKNPADALKKAENWAKNSQSLSAQHCRSIALFELGRYAESAGSLDSLARMAAKNKPALLLDIAKQASIAWQKAGKPESAVASITYAVNTAQNNSRMADVSNALLERARLYRKFSQPLNAVQDLDQALNINGADKAALLERAQVFMGLGQSVMAKDDLNRVLAVEPGNAQAALLLQQIK